MLDGKVRRDGRIDVKKEEFIAELHKELDRRYGMFEEYQNIVWDIFQEFHRVCEKDGIEYYLAFGSLLGFIRDGDMIPWDSDIDVLLPIDQLDKLMNALRMSLDEAYYFVSSTINPKYPNYMTRICKKGLNSDIVHLDILYLLGAADSREENQKMQSEIKKLIHLREEKLVKVIRKENGKIHFYFRGIGKKVRLLGLPLKKIHRQIEEICNRYPYREAENYITLGHGAEYFPACIFESGKELTWRTGKVIVPKDYERFLEIRYGNYESYLPITSRFDEFLLSYSEYVNYGSRREEYNE